MTDTMSTRWTKGDELDGMFPLSDAETDALHALGWESGYGWDTQPDWYWTPSTGAPIWIEDAEDIGRRWLADLMHIRKEAAERKRIEKLHDAAEDMYEALQALLKCAFDYHDAHSLTQPVTGRVGNAMDQAIAALKAAEGERE